MKVFSKFFEVLARRAGSQNPHWYTVLQEKSYKQKTFDVGIPMGDALLGKCTANIYRMVIGNFIGNPLSTYSNFTYTYYTYR